MTRPTLEALLKRGVAVFDGAMGTELYKRHQFVNTCFEQLCLTRPDLVRAVHRENRDAGADVLTTNSYGANRYSLAGFNLADRAYDMAKTSAMIAREVAGDDLLVAGSVGRLTEPVGPFGIDEQDAIEAFDQQIRGLKDGGADLIIFETFGRRRDLLTAVEALKPHDLPYIASMAFSDRNITRSGETVEAFFAPLPDHLPQPAMLGFNCGVGPREMLEYLELVMGSLSLPVLVQPNAGYPKTVHDRVIYMSSPEYLATYAGHFVQVGARAVGGCCGHGPEHIKAVCQGVKRMYRTRESAPGMRHRDVSMAPPVPVKQRSRLACNMGEGRFVTSVEIVPPLGWDLTDTLAKARLVKDAGVDAINIPDGPRASSRMSPLVTCQQIQDRVGVECVLHVTCRDRNAIGLQSDLLGCAAAGVRNLLLVTGDPPKLGDYPFASGVFDIDSVGLTRIAHNLNHGLDIGDYPVRPPTPFFMGVGVDPAKADLAAEIAHLARKKEAGALFAITQPVWEPQVLLSFVARAREVGLPVIAGVWPLISLRNAQFLNNEVPGIHIPEAVMARMAACRTREEARAEGIAIAREFLAGIRHAVAGVQVSAPLGDVAMALEVLA